MTALTRLAATISARKSANQLEHQLRQRSLRRHAPFNTLRHQLAAAPYANDQKRYCPPMEKIES